MGKFNFDPQVNDWALNCADQNEALAFFEPATFFTSDIRARQKPSRRLAAIVRRSILCALRMCPKCKAIGFLYSQLPSSIAKKTTR